MGYIPVICRLKPKKGTTNKTKWTWDHHGIYSHHIPMTIWPLFHQKPPCLAGTNMYMTKRHVVYIYSEYIPTTFLWYSQEIPFPMTSPACFPFLSHINRLSMPMVLTFRFLFRSQECDTNSDGLISREDRHHMEKDIMGFIVFWCWVASKIQCLAMLDNDRPQEKTPGSSFWKMDSESWCIFVVRQSPG